jgi:hypothetical protein
VGARGALSDAITPPLRVDEGGGEAPTELEASVEEQTARARRTPESDHAGVEGQPFHMSLRGQGQADGRPERLRLFLAQGLTTPSMSWGSSPWRAA